jgi:AraC-like DNA-binding protein
VAANDLMAVQAVQELNLRGIDVPEDVIVTGFDNLSNENCSAYFLTTVNQSAFQMGFTAAESLFGLSIGRTCKDLIKLPTELILRSSCGCIQSQKEKDDPDHFPKKCKTEAAGTMSRKSLLSKNNERGFVFSVLCKALGTVKNIEGLKRALLDAFPKLHIKSCYISLFESNKYSRNIFFYKDYNMRKLKETDESFQTYDLVPGGTRKLGRENDFIMMTLSRMNDALGFVLYESENSQNELFEILTLNLSSALQRLVDDDVLETTCKKINPDYQIHSSQKYKYLKCGLPDGKAKWFYKKLLKTMESEEIYKNPDLTLPDLAGKLHISRNHLSHVINVSAGVNFFDFINRYRINEAKRILSDPEAENFNILNIAFEAGFKSKSTFNKVFKKFTAKTPKEFRRDKKIIKTANVSAVIR